MTEFTQEQVDAMVAEKAKEIAREKQIEFDKKVESAIQKGIETQRTKWENDFSVKANLSAEEKAKRELEEKEQAIAQRERDLKKQSNKLSALEMLTSAQIPQAQYENSIHMLVSDDDVTTRSNVKNFIDIIAQTKSETEARLKAEFSKITQPNTNPDGKEKAISKQDFDKMGYAQKAKFKVDNPELFKQFMK